VRWGGQRRTAEQIVTHCLLATSTNAPQGRASFGMMACQEKESEPMNLSENRVLAAILTVAYCTGVNRPGDISRERVMNNYQWFLDLLSEPTEPKGKS